VLLRIEVDPPGASVRVGDYLVNPPNVRVARSSTPLRIVAEAPDRLPQAREVVPEADQLLVIHLAPAAVAPRPRSAPPPRRHGGARTPSPTMGDLRDPFAE
jgi:hypothetical protein